ncbi:hypothetical protein HX049_11310 [Myroides odoratimimus]|uniref:hypothetical protein n=1 Tax=Myroides odoratimimus TaxID=76832 RepID=UPI002577601E|nr:hypothetical protein [Myroides odoratimimus]MDM1397767.1 hypothetical protein [Myroides odoratimimus]
MISIVDELIEVTKYKQEAIHDYWILISYRESIWKEETFKEAILINVEKKNYYRDNILENSNLHIKIEIEEIRTINFPLGSILDKNGKLLCSPLDCGKGQFMYDYEIFINTKKDKLILFNNEESIDFSFIQGVPCYLLKSSGIEFIIPIHTILDFLFYHDTEVTNFLVKDFDLIDSVTKISRDTLSFSSTIIKQAIVEKISPYFFTSLDTGLNALRSINAHKSVWLNQEKMLEECRAYVTTEFPFSPASLKVRGMFLTKYLDESRKFLVFGIDDAYPYKSSKPFINVDEILLEDLTDRRSIDVPNAEYQNGSNTRNIKGNFKNEEDYKLTRFPTNNSLPEVESKTLKSKKINFNVKIKKLEKKEQHHKYANNSTIAKEIDGVSTNYNDYDNTTNITRLVTKEIETDFSFFKVFFKAMNLLNEEGCKVEYLMLNGYLNSNITWLSCSSVSKFNISYLLVSICQIEVKGENYVIIEAGKNYYIGMFKCLDGNKFKINNDLRLSTFLSKVINRHDYNWSKINSIENIKFQQRDQIKIFMPFVHPCSKVNELEKERVEAFLIINEMAEKLVDKIKKRVTKDI